MPAPVIESLPYKNISASGVVSAQRTKLLGFFVNSFTGGATLKLWDNAAAGTAPIVMNTFTPLVAGWNACPFTFTLGIYATISGTMDVTFAIDPGG